MKFHVIHDQHGKVVAALRATPQKLADGREVKAVVRLNPGQTSKTVDVAGNLRGAELLEHIAKLRPTA
jgi:hypothetical protein